MSTLIQKFSLDKTLYCEFLDQWGNLRYDLYGKRGLHIKPKGKVMMTRTMPITEFSMGILTFNLIDI